MDRPRARIVRFAATVAGVVLVYVVASSAFAQGAAEFEQLPPNAITEIDAGQLRKARKTGRLTVPLPGKAGSARAIVLSHQRRFGIDSLRAQEGDTRILLTTNGIEAFGAVERGDDSYVIDSLDGKTVVADASRLSAGYEELPESVLYDDVVIDPRMEEKVRQDLQRRKSIAPGSQAVDPDTSVVDIAVFYEQSLLDGVDTISGLRLRAQGYVDYTNEAFRLSGVPVSLRLVFVGQYPREVARDPIDGLIGTPPDNVGRIYGADLWHLLVDKRVHIGPAGRAAIVGIYGYTMYPDTGSTFRHEVGHNFGAHHDRANIAQWGNTSLPISAYNYAHSCGGEGTAMHYFTPTVRSRRDHFSTPDIVTNGEPCGIAFDQPNAAHNAKAIDVTRQTVAAFQPAQSILGSVGFAAEQVTVTENAGTVTVKVRRDGDLTRSSSVEVYSLGQTATAGSDFGAVLERLVFAPGQAERDVKVSIVDDTAGEPTESLKLILASPNLMTIGRDEFILTIDSDYELLNPAEEMAEFSPAGLLRWGEWDADAYEVWAYRDPQLTQLVETSGAITSRHYQFTRLAPGSKYYVKVYYRKNGTWLERGPWTLQTAAVVVKPRVVNAQEELEAFVDEGVLRWLPISGADTYEVWVYADAALSALVHTSGPIRETQYLLSGLVPGSTVFVRLYSRIDGVFHAGAATPVVVTHRSDRARVLNAQEELDAFATDGILRWTAVTAATKYEVWIFTNANSSEIFESSGPLEGRSYRTRTLAPETTYYAQVYAQVNGQWQVGAPFKFTTAATVKNARLSNPQQELEALPSSGTLHWTEVPGADAYELWIYTNPGLGGVAESFAAGSARSYKPTKLCGGGTYYVQVFARVNGTWSTGWPTRVTTGSFGWPSGCVFPAPVAWIRLDKSSSVYPEEVGGTRGYTFVTSCTWTHTVNGRRGKWTNLAILSSAQATAGSGPTAPNAYEPGINLFSLSCTGPGGTAVAQAVLTVL